MLGRQLIVADDLFNFGYPERSGFDIRLGAIIGVSIPRSGGRRRRHWLGATEIVGVHDPAHVPKLRNDATARIMNPPHDWPPRTNLLLGPESRGAGPAQALLADAGRLRDD